MRLKEMHRKRQEAGTLPVFFYVVGIIFVFIYIAGIISCRASTSGFVKAKLSPLWAAG